MDIEQEYKLLLSLEIPKEPKRKKTWLEITKQPHYENVISNLYQFYLDNEEEHDLKDLFLTTFLEVIEERTGKKLEFSDYSVNTEISTNNNGRIDILIEENDASKAIIIENKIYHNLNNDLEDYWQSTLASPNNKAGIVLSLNKVGINNSNFFNLTHSEFMNRLKKNLGYYIEECDDRHSIFLKDFITNLSNLNNSHRNMETIKFYFKYQNKIDQLVVLKDKATEHFISEIQKAISMLDTEFVSKKGKNTFNFRAPNCENIMFWIERYNDPGDVSFCIGLFTVNQNKKLLQNIFNNKEIETICKEKGVTIEFEEDKKIIYLAWKEYDPSPDNYVDLSNYLTNTINEDWKELTKKIDKKYEAQQCI
jgi:hypothetical protein